MADQTKTLKVGDAAPDFELKGTGGTEFKLSDYRGKKSVALAFFPAAFSGPCSQQMPQIQAKKSEFDASEAVVVGISVDNTWSLAAFAQQLGLEFPLLSDFYPHGAVAERYGVLRDNGVCERAVIGIDKQGAVRYIDVHPIREVPDTEPCLAALK